MGRAPSKPPQKTAYGKERGVTVQGAASTPYGTEVPVVVSSSESETEVVPQLNSMEVYAAGL
eukprot:15140025-Heterocapsa_arctica.AAC.2